MSKQIDKDTKYNKKSEKNRIKLENLVGTNTGRFLDKLLRDFLKARFSRCMLYRHNAAIRTD